MAVTSSAAIASPARGEMAPVSETGGQADGHAHVDYDVHGVIGIRLLNAGPDEVSAVERQLGGMRCLLRREPDLLLRFVERLPTPDLRYVEVHRSGFTEKGFFVLWHRRQPIRVRVPFDRLGQPCELECQRGLGSVPLLKQILKLTALRKGFVAVHASAFEYAGSGIVATGWTHGGKTSTLLAFAEHGARYVGDDLVFLGPRGRQMFGMASPIGLSEWQLDQLPRLQRQLPRRKLWTVRGIRGIERLQRRFDDGPSGRAFPVRLLKAAVPPLRRRFARLQMKPKDVFGENIRLVAEPQKLFLIISRDSPRIDIEPADPAAVADRMLISMRHENLSLLGSYLEYRFAFPDRTSDLIEGANEIEADLLRSAIGGMDAYVVQHPFPVPLRALYDAMRPYCDTKNIAGLAASEKIGAR